MFNKNGDIAKRGVLHGLQQAVSKIPEPESYYCGLEPPLPLLPQNILLFQRSALRTDMNRGAHHHRFVLLVNLKTEGSVIVDDLLLPLPEHHALLVFPYQFHTYAGLEHKDILWFFITFELQSCEALQVLRNTPVPVDVACWARMDTIAHSFVAGGCSLSDRAATMQMELSLVLRSLLHVAKETDSSTVFRARPERVGDEAYALVEKVCSYVYRHIGEPLPIVHVAKAMSLSESRLRERFREVVGVGLGSFIRHNRIHRAQTLLASSSLNVTEIAEQCGFESLYTFSRTFKMQVRMAPSAFRKEIRTLTAHR